MIWGFAFVVVKNSLDAIGPTYLLAFRFTIAALVLAVIFHKRLKNLSKPVLLEGAVLGGYLFSIPQRGRMPSSPPSMWCWCLSFTGY